MNRTAANGPAPAPAVETQAEPDLLDRVVQATHEARQYSIEELRYMAKAASQSRLFGMEEAQAFVLMQLCEAEGLHPIQAVRRFDIIEGKPTMKAAAMQAEFTRHGGKITWRERTAEVCAADFSHPVLQPEPLPIRITLEELKKNGVAVAKDGGLKKNYRQHPRSMLHARVISEGVRAVDPGIVVGLYTPEEVSDFDDRPSPRPLSADAPASRPGLAMATPEPPAEPSPQPAHSEARQWMQARVDEINANWAMTCAMSKKDYKPLCNLHQLVNALITKWLEGGILSPEHVYNADGKRDKRKVAEVLRASWDDDSEATQNDVDMYLKLKQEEAAKAAGIELDAEPTETTSDV